MPVIIKCPDCGHTEQSADGESKTCPQCEGTMAAPPKKKYQAKSSSLEEEERAKKKEKPREAERPKQKARPRDEDEDEEEEEKPTKKKTALKQEAMSLDDDEDDEKAGDDFPRNGKPAERLGLDPGFKNRALMKQVGKELSRGEVLYFACRPSEAIAKKTGMIAMVAGGIFALLGIVGIVLVLTVLSDKVPWPVAIAGAFFALIGAAIAILGPIMTKRQAKMGWYAVTDRRAIVFNINLWGKKGQVEVYPPEALRKMWIKKSFWVKGGGSLVFKTEVHDNRTRYVDRRTGRTVKTTGSRTEHHYGFMGIEDVKDVEALVHEVLLGRQSDDEEEEDDDD